MVEKADLRRVPAFVDLPDDQLDWFLGNSQELDVARRGYLHPPRRSR